MTILGTQYILTLEGCRSPYVNEPDQVIQSVTEVTQASGLSIVKAVEHRFEPYGLTFMLLLSQSHLIVHTWPEYNTMIVDVFVCVQDFDIDSFSQRLVVATGAQALKQEVVVFESHSEFTVIP